MGTKFTRGEFLTAVSAGAALIALTNTPGCKPAERAMKTRSSPTSSPAQPDHVLVYDAPSTLSQRVWTFRSRPDLSPPAVDVARQVHDTASGYIFVAPKTATVA